MPSRRRNCEKSPNTLQYQRREKLFWPSIGCSEESPDMEMPFEARMPSFKEPYGKCRMKSAPPFHSGFIPGLEFRNFPMKRVTRILLLNFALLLVWGREGHQ